MNNLFFVEIVVDSVLLAAVQILTGNLDLEVKLLLAKRFASAVICHS